MQCRGDADAVELHAGTPRRRRARGYVQLTNMHIVARGRETLPELEVAALRSAGDLRIERVVDVRSRTSRRRPVQDAEDGCRERDSRLRDRRFCDCGQRDMLAGPAVNASTASSRTPAAARPSPATSEHSNVNSRRAARHVRSSRVRTLCVVAMRATAPNTSALTPISAMRSSSQHGLPTEAEQAPSGPNSDASSRPMPDIVSSRPGMVNRLGVASSRNRRWRQPSRNVFSFVSLRAAGSIGSVLRGRASAAATPSEHL